MEENNHQEQILLELFDEVHDTIHMLRHMAGHYLEKAEDLEMNLAAAVRLQLVDLGSMRDIHSASGDCPTEEMDAIVIPFPEGGDNG